MKDLKEVVLEKYQNRFDENLVLNLVSTSESAEFYNEMYVENPTNVAQTDLLHKNKKENQEKGEAYIQMEKVVSLLKNKLAEDAIIIEIGGSVHQKRSGNAYNRFKNYFPLDISSSSMARYSERYNKASIAADATELPFKDNSIDCIFTHTFLEHPLKPEAVLQEITRVLKPGGIVIHNDAWFCRWWQRFGVVGLKSFQSMNLKEKFVFIMSRVTEFPLFRISPIIIKRLLRHTFQPLINPISLNYNKLKPNYELQIAADEDAASSIDPIDVIRFYESRGFKTESSLSLKQRLFYPNKFICLIKNSL